MIPCCFPYAVYATAITHFVVHGSARLHHGNLARPPFLQHSPASIEQFYKSSELLVIQTGLSDLGQCLAS
eukprot:5757211-Pleurochrysis_carterae.AAC.3